MGSRGSSACGGSVPSGWQVVDYVHGIAVLQPTNPKQSFSLPRESNMPGMTLDELKQTMTTHDEIEFSYRDEPYDFQKESADDSRIKISIWRGGDNPECRYSITISDGEPFADDLINAKIFPDGKSIVEGEADIDVEFFT